MLMILQITLICTKSRSGIEPAKTAAGDVMLVIRLSPIFISDFQKSIVNIQQYQDTTLEVNLVPVQSMAQKNITIDSAWFEGPVFLFLIKPINYSSKLKTIVQKIVEQVKISFLKDGQEKPVAITDIPANGTVTDTVNLTIEKSGWHTW
jgi:hypothetical protein